MTQHRVSNNDSIIVEELARYHYEQETQDNPFMPAWNKLSWPADDTVIRKHIKWARQWYRANKFIVNKLIDHDRE